MMRFPQNKTSAKRHSSISKLMLTVLLSLPLATIAGTTETVFELLPNGDFSGGLTGWTSEVSPLSAAPAGDVNADAGAARLTKGGAFYVGLSQSFTAPEGLQALRLAVTEEPVFQSTGRFVPEVFEVHVTSAGGGSVVSTWRPGGTASGSSGANGNTFVTGAGTTYSNGEFRIPLAGVTANEMLTLTVSLVGASSDTVASTAIDNVRLELERLVEPPMTDAIFGCELFRDGLEAERGVGKVFRCPLGQLGDTGLTQCVAADGSGDCPLPAAPGQDAEQGRDALATVGALGKLGAGPAGFDYTKVDVDGSLLDDDAVAFSCVIDGHTGLMWEVKVDDAQDPGHFDHRYSWYESDMNRDGGSAGVLDGGNCSGSRCDTEGLVTAINDLRLCGVSDWRMPTRAELMSLVNAGNANPAASTNYFPFSGGETWTGTADAANVSAAWRLEFDDGSVGTQPKSQTLRVRLVREVK
ncbi:MAG: DUF1566 domain-containing protein [Pseudomonadota bacterium]